MKPKTSRIATAKSVNLLIALVFFIAVSMTGCSTNVGSRAVAKYNQNPLTVVIPAGLSPDTVTRAMIETVTRRRWIVQSHSNNEVVATLKHRGYDVTATLRSDGSLITILNEATYWDDHTGTHKPAVPVSWLVKMQKTLQKTLQLKLL